MSSDWLAPQGRSCSLPQLLPCKLKLQFCPSRNVPGEKLTSPESLVAKSGMWSSSGSETGSLLGGTSGKAIIFLINKRTDSVILSFFLFPSFWRGTTC